MSIKRIIKKTGKALLYLLLFVLILLGGSLIFVNTDYGKKIVKNKIQSYLQLKLQTKVIIGSVDYSLPKWIELKNVYIEDQHKDTLLFGEQLAVDLDMFKLIRGITYIRKVELKNIYTNIYRSASDSVFNFEFFVNAFSGNKSAAVVNPDTAALKLTMNELSLKNVRVKFNDNFGGTYFTSAIKNLDATLNKFQPDRLQFDINKFAADSIDFFMVNNKESTVSNASSSQNTLQLLASELYITNANVFIQDRNNGMLYANKAQRLILTNGGIDIAKEEIAASSLSLDNSFVKFIAPERNNSITDSSTASLWKIKLDRLRLGNDRFQLDDNAVDLKEGLDPAHLDLQHIYVSAGDVLYTPESMIASIQQLAFKDRSGFILDTLHADIAYNNKQISATALYLQTPYSVLQNSIVLKYVDIAALTTMPANTTVDIKLDKSVIAVNDLYTLVPSVKKYMQPQKFRNNIVRLNTAVTGTLKELSIPSLQLSGFSGTVINAKAILYNITDANNLAYDITVFNSSIPRSDIVKFLPIAGDSVTKKIPPLISLSTHIKGNLQNSKADININSNGFRFLGRATVKNIKSSRLQYDVKIIDSRIDKTFITAMIPSKLLPQSIQLPATIIVKGAIKGDNNNIEPDVSLGGSYGSAAVKGYIRNFSNKETATYDLAITTNDFQVGKLMKKDSLMDNISLSAVAKGKGFNYKTMNSDVTTTIQSAGFKQYNYHDITLNAQLNNGNIISSGNINDSNLQMQYQVTANVNRQYPSVEATIVVDTVQLLPLHLYNDVLNASLKAYIKADNLDPAKLNLYAVIDSSRLNLRNKLYALDSIVVTANDSASINNLSVRSPVLDLIAKGDFDYDKIGPSLIRYIDKYYNIAENNTTASTTQQVAFKGTVKKHPLVIDLVPGLNYETFNFSGNYASQQKDSSLVLNADVPYLSYKADRVAGSKISVTTFNDKINAAVDFDTLAFRNNIFYSTNIKADVSGDSVGVSVRTKDQNKTDRFAIGATMVTKNKSYAFSLKDTLLLNYEKWNVAAGNRILYSPDGILVNNFSISNNDQKIIANSQQAVLNSPVDIAIENFNIKSITSFLNSDTLLAEGIINAQFSVSDFNKQLPAFTGNAAITQLQYKQQPVGDIKLFARKQDDNTINATLNLTGNGNKVDITSTYYLNNSQQEFDAVIDIQQLRLATLQAFSNGNLENSSGALHGNIALNGKFSQPHWKGFIGFDTVKFTVRQFGTSYLIDKQKITLNYPVVSFDHFTIKDSIGQSMVINGTAESISLTNYDLGLNIKADDFTLVNAPKAINNEIYGFAAIDADIDISGNTSRPDIEGYITLNDKTDVTLVLPDRNTNKDAALPIVRFVDLDTFAIPLNKPFSPEKEIQPAFAQFLNYNLNIEVHKEAALTIVIDPSTGDELRVQGDAQLNAGVDPGGNIVLAGNYELSSGHYVLTYQFLEKKFELQPGSTIAFSGQPMDAQIDITAVYIANTSAKDLLGNEVGEVDAGIANSFNQKIPFKVLLHLKGQMKKPEISFDIQLPDENTEMNAQLRTIVENKLAQLRDDVAATDKQVFSLLLLNRFAGEQSSDFFKGNGLNFNDLARESVSEFLTSALNQIAGDLFKGVDIDLNLNSYKDYSSVNEQQRTDLNVAITKRFLDDRLSVSVGRNFGVGGEDAGAKASQQNGYGFMPDVTLSYKLTKDGKYLLKGYKKNQFEVILDGYVVETGVAFIVTMDYDKFSELFRRKKKAGK